MRDITRGALHLAMQITGNREEARDIVQTAVVKSLEHRSAPRPDEDGFRPWFYRVVHNQAIDWLRSRRRIVEGIEVADTVGEDLAPDEALDAESRRVLLHKALNSLKSEQREIICLKDFHGFSYNEIADIMDIEKGTVMSRLHRARMALKDALLALPSFPGEHHGQRL